MLSKLFQGKLLGQLGINFDIVFFDQVTKCRKNPVGTSFENLSDSGVGLQLFMLWTTHVVDTSILEWLEDKT